MKHKRFAALVITVAALAFPLTVSGCKKPDGGQNVPEHAVHAYDRKVTDSKYRKSEATCTAKAVYYYSCECGEMGEATFEYGEKLSHEFTAEKAEDKYLMSSATCTEKAIYHKSCIHCGESGTETFEYGQLANHSYKNGKCEVCGEKDPSFVANADGFAFEPSADGNSFIVTGIGEVNVQNIVIPSTHEGKPVTEIADNAFEGNKEITSLTIPDSVTKIGTNAFFSNKALTTVKFGSRLKTIGIGAFQFCENLTGLEATVEQMCSIDFKSQYANPLLYAHTLTENGNKIESIIIPDTVYKIGNSAFYGCDANALLIHDNVSSIGDQAFKMCENLTNVKLGNGLTSIGTDPFAGCGRILYNEYGNGLYLGNTDTEYLVLVKAKNTDISSCTINAETEYILSNAFSGCGKLTEITIPVTVSYIGSTAFRGCTSLKTVNYNAYNVTTTYSVGLSNNPFNGCTAIEDIFVGERVSCIPKLMFRKCGVKNVTFSGKKTKLLAKAFGNCSNLVKILYLQGTQAEWQALTKANDWAENTGEYVVYCSDGNISKA